MILQPHTTDRHTQKVNRSAERLCSMSEENTLSVEDFGVTVPSAKKARVCQSLDGNGPAKMFLTSDAHDLEDKLLASQISKQPFKIWYNTGKHSKNQIEPDYPDSTSLVPTGKGIMAAVLDSGINEEHMAFQGGIDKISPHSRSFVGGDICDRLGHGTQCAGLLCGCPSEVFVHDYDTNQIVHSEGIATDAKVMVCKVVKDGSNIVNMDTMCRAIDYIVQYNRECVSAGKGEKVDVISLSFGATGFNHELTQKIQEALCENIIVVCAASNSGMKSRQPITFPARLGHVLCIGACNDSGKPTSFTPVGREIDFLAPGESLWAPTVGGRDSYCAVSGTSFATPSVAGVVCQVLEDLQKLSSSSGEPQLLPLMSNVWCIRELLTCMATTQGRHSDESGYGKLNPMEYFEKNDMEKRRIIKKILQQ